MHVLASSLGLAIIEVQYNLCLTKTSDACHLVFIMTLTI